jgi:hypothetical protein
MNAQPFLSGNIHASLDEHLYRSPQSLDRLDHSLSIDAQTVPAAAPDEGAFRAAVSKKGD